MFKFNFDDKRPVASSWTQKDFDRASQELSNGIHTYEFEAFRTRRGGGNRWEMQSAGDESVRKEVAKLNLQRFEAHFGWQMRKTGTRNLPRPAEWKLMISAS